MESVESDRHPKRVFFLVSHSSAGGAQEIWVNLAAQFLARGYDVQLVALYPLRKDVRKSSDNLPWQYVVERQPRNPFEAVKLFMALVRMLRTDRPSFVLTALPAANVMAAAAARLAGAGISVITSHHSPASTYNTLLNWVDSITGSLRSVVGVVCVSDFVKSSLAGKPRVYVEKAVTIKNALPPDIEATIAELRLGRKQTAGRRIVATGRLAYQKNYPALIRAARYLNDVEIIIVGGGPDEAALKALAAELKVEDRVSFLGHMARGDTLAMLSSGDVFSQPSRFEGHSLALIEAAKFGIPLVVSDIPVQVEGLTASTGEVCGLVVPLEDDRRLAQEIEHLLDDTAYRLEWSTAADRLASEITFDNVIWSYEQLMERKV